MFCLATLQFSNTAIFLVGLSINYRNVMPNLTKFTIAISNYLGIGYVYPNKQVKIQ